MLNKKFFGRWKQDNEEELNVIDRSGNLIIKQSFIESGYFNCEPVEYKYTKDTIKISINDEEHRAVYGLSLSGDNALSGTYTQYGKTKVVIYSRVSDTPCDDEFYYKPSKMIVEESKLGKIELLREYAKYIEDQIGEFDNNSDKNFTYMNDEREKMLDIIENEKLDELTTNLDDVNLVIELMRYVCGKYKHNGQSGMPYERSAHKIIEYCNNHDGKINCRGLAILLAQFIRAYGIKAFHITCLPYEEPFGDCHVVVCAFCKSINKWIMLDPTYCLYLKDKAGAILGIEDLRNSIIAGNEFIPNKDANYCGESFVDKYMEYYREYMAKNTIRLQRGRIVSYGCEDKQGNVVLIPEKYMTEAENFCEEEKKHFITSPSVFWERECNSRRAFPCQ